jgi:hypothetical protein
MCDVQNTKIVDIVMCDEKCYNSRSVLAVLAFSPQKKKKCCWDFETKKKKIKKNFLTESNPIEFEWPDCFKLATIAQ